MACFSVRGSSYSHLKSYLGERLRIYYSVYHRTYIDYYFYPSIIFCVFHSVFIDSIFSALKTRRSKTGSSRRRKGYIVPST